MVTKLLVALRVLTKMLLTKSFYEFRCRLIRILEFKILSKMKS